MSIFGGKTKEQDNILNDDDFVAVSINHEGNSDEYSSKCVDDGYII